MEWAAARGWRSGGNPVRRGRWSPAPRNARPLPSMFRSVTSGAGRTGFHASPCSALPPGLSGEVNGIRGGILSYLPHRMARGVAAGCPDGLKPKDLLTAYNALPLAQAGYTGKGQTIVVFAFDGFGAGRPRHVRRHHASAPFHARGGRQPQ